MAPNKKALALQKAMEKLKKEQEVDSDEMEEEEEEEEEEEQGEEEEEEQGEEEEDSGLDNGNEVDADFQEDDDEDEDEESEEEDEEGNKIPKVKKVASKEGEEDEEEEEEEEAREQLMMNQKGGQPDQAILNMKINDILHVLAKFKENNKEDRSRQSYLEELTDYLMQYYNYNRDLIQLFMTMFNPNELVSFLEANEAQRPVTIRTNTLKTRRKELAQILIQRGVNLDTLADWTKVGLKIYDTKVPIGATPEYLAGHYMLQSASSFLPVIALAPQQNEKILDMAAAPGGKTTYIAQLMKNTGVLFANDIKADRNKALIFNVQRMGINNCIVTNFDGRKLPKIINNCDRVLLDAPCTGLGIIARDASIKATKQLIDVQKHAHLQRELILSAIDCCKKGGYIVYSTCSVSVQENESVVDFALKNRFVKLVDMGIEVGEEGYTKYQDRRFDPQLKKSRRILPHVHNMDGFYVAKLKKLENGPRTNKEEVANSNLEVSHKTEFKEEETLADLKNKKVQIKQGAQGVVEVTANGEDFDWNEEDQEKFEIVSKQKQDLQKTIHVKKEAKIKDDKKALKEKVSQKQLINQQKKEDAASLIEKNLIEDKKKKLSKKEAKIAAKTQEKLAKASNSTEELSENVTDKNEHVTVNAQTPIQKKLLEPKKAHGKQIDNVKNPTQKENHSVAEKGETVAKKGEAVAKKGKTITEKDETVVIKSETVAKKGKIVAEKDETVVIKGETVAQKGKTVSQKDETIVTQGETVAKKDFKNNKFNKSQSNGNKQQNGENKGGFKGNNQQGQRDATKKKVKTN